MIKFIKLYDEKNSCDYSDVEVIYHGDTLDSLLETFEEFLMAAGFHYAPKYLEEYYGGKLSAN